MYGTVLLVLVFLLRSPSRHTVEKWQTLCELTVIIISPKQTKTHPHKKKTNLDSIEKRHDGPKAMMRFLRLHTATLLLLVGNGSALKVPDFNLDDAKSPENLRDLTFVSRIK